MFCSKCGKEIPDNSAFCLSCGAPVAQAAQPQPVQQVQPPQSFAPQPVQLQYAAPQQVQQTPPAQAFAGAAAQTAPGKRAERVLL